jgi:hypothetical protein
MVNRIQRTSLDHRSSFKDGQYAAKKSGLPKEEEFESGIPIHQAALNMTPKRIMAEIILT